ncbi:MAG: TIGR01212 family radical SAM protein [Lachnospiraceae bacterium]|nr:TIGR01212 family radical SAM protein [Lachnospiraceae bacterium]
MAGYQGRPYYSLDAYLKECYGEKVYKLSLDGGMTCPNRDGTCGDRGCIFCSAGGSGDFAADRSLSVPEQIASQKALVKKKRPVRKFIAYFQAYTNTYAPVSYLEKIFLEAISDPEVVILSVATRPDCLGSEVLELLDRINRIKPVWVELGLQTIHEQTARYIRRGYELSCFEEAVRELQRRNLQVIVHTILGLPGESEREVLQTMDYLNQQPVSGIKLQLLHVLRGTDLAEDYLAGKFEVLTKEQYLQLVIDCLTHLRPDLVIHRLTGDGPGELLIAPLWSQAKRTVLNELHHQMKLQNACQGLYYQV